MLSGHSSFALNFSVQNEQRARLEIARVLKEVEDEREKQAQMRRALKNRAQQEQESSSGVHTPASPLAPLRRFESITFELDGEDETSEQDDEDYGGKESERGGNQDDGRVGATGMRHRDVESPARRNHDRMHEQVSTVEDGGGRDGDRRVTANCQRFRTASPVSSASGMPDTSYHARAGFHRGKTGESP